MREITAEQRIWHPRPAVYAAAGALLGSLLWTSLPVWALVSAGALLLAGAGFLFRKRLAAFALPLFFALVLLRSLLFPAALAPGLSLISGCAESVPEHKKAGWTLTLGRLRVDDAPTSGTLTLVFTEEPDIALGDTVSVQALVQPAYVHTAGGSRGTAMAKDVPAVTPYGGFSPYIWALRCREKLEGISAALFGDHVGEANGMLLGDRSQMSYTRYRSYKRSGLMHLLCVSGLHVSVVAGAVLFLIRGKRKWVRFLLTVLFLLLYTALTGFSVSSMRAALMLLLTQLTVFTDRQKDTFSALGLSFALLLVLDPAYLHELGFALSYSAVLGLAALQRPMTELFPKKAHRFAAPFTASLAACIGTAPLLCRASGGLEWAGLLLSPIAIPLTPFFLIPGWIALLLWPVSPALSTAVSQVARGVLLCLDGLTTLGARNALAMPAPGIPTLVLWYAGLLLLSPYFLPNSKRPPRYGYAALGLSLLFWLLSAFGVIPGAV